MQNKIKKVSTSRPRSIEYAQFKILRVLSRVMYVCAASILIASFWFLYTRMYRTIGQVASISAISPFAKVQVLDISTYDTVQSILTQKQAQTVPVLTRDAFNSVALITPIQNIESNNTTTTVLIDTSTTFTQDL